MKITRGFLTGLFSFDVGYEIALDELARCLAPLGVARREGKESTGIRGAGRTVDLRLPPLSVTLPELTAEATVTLRAHDFGALSLALRLPLAGDLAALGPLMATLVRTRAVERLATDCLGRLLPVATPAISRGSPSEFVEDYYIVHVEEFDRPVTPAELTEHHRDAIASALRCEKDRLTAREVEEVFETAVSYHPQDLVVSDWNGAFLYTREADRLFDALEFLNVQLIELRFFDRRLDLRLTELFQAVYYRPRWRTLVYNPFHRSLEEVSELKVETTLIADRLGNAIKFIDDLYLVKVYETAAQPLHLEAWRASVDARLKVIHEIFEILKNRASTYRAEVLELTIILLIALEIVLSFVR